MPIKLTSDSIQAIASLISKKNILINWYEGNGVPRADIKSNVIWLPRIGTEDDNDLRVFSWHEAGHHRHTKRAGEEFESSKIKFDILNGLEDVRMEALVKKDFPGTISIFHEVDTRIYNKTKENMEAASSPEWTRKLLSLMFWAKGFPELHVCDEMEKKLMMKASRGSFTVCKSCAAALFEKWKAEFEEQKQKQSEQSNGSNEGDGEGQGEAQDSSDDENTNDSNRESGDGEGDAQESQSSSQDDNGQNGPLDFDDEMEQNKESSSSDGKDKNEDAEKKSEGSDGKSENGDDLGKDESEGNGAGDSSDDSNENNESEGDSSIEGDKAEGESSENKQNKNAENKKNGVDDVSHQSDANGFNDNFDDDSLIQEVQNFLKDSLMQKQKDYESGEGVQSLESYPRVDAKVSSLQEFVGEHPWIRNNHSQLRDNHQKLIGVIQNSIQAKMKAKTTRFLKEGEVDSFLLDRVRTSDRIFYRREQKKQNKVAVSMVIDASGSMSYEMAKALYVAITIGKCLASIGVNYEIVTQTDTFRGFGISGMLYSKITEIKGFNRSPNSAADVDFLTAYSTGHSLCVNNFADSEAVNLARIRLNKISAKRRIILMMTDGCACVGGIDSSSLEKMSKHEIEKCKRDGVEVYAVGIGTQRCEEFRRIYENAEGCIDVDVNGNEDALITSVLPLFKEFILKKI